MVGGLAPDQRMLDELYMHRAIELARRGWGRVHPNPLVGAVVVRDGAIVGEGWHAEYGGAHAEVAALEQAGEAARGATLYVSLEPCDHHGKTPPCSAAVLAAGIARLVYAAEDPNPRAGGGAERLRAAGIDVEGGLCREEAREQNRSFFHVQETGGTFLLLKLALSLDGCIAAAPGVRTQLTGPSATAAVHRLRAGFDAVLVGSTTAAIDDPLLTARGDVVPRVPPVRVVLDSLAALDPSSTLVATAAEAPVWVVCADDAPAEARTRLEAAGVRTLGVPRDGAHLDVAAALAALAGVGLRTVLCEGGGRVAGAFLRADLVQRMSLFYAPKLLGASGVRALPNVTPDAAEWKLISTARHEQDVCLTFDRVLTPPAEI